VSAETPEPVDQSDAFAWLEGLAAEQGAPEDELVTPQEARTLEPPDWIKVEESWDKQPTGRLDPRETLEEPVLSPLPTSEPPDKQTAEPEEVIPDWLAGLEDISEEAIDEITTADFGKQEVESELAADLPEWLTEEPVEAEDVDTGIAAETPVPPQIMEDLDLPEWLQAPEGEPVAETQATSEAEPPMPAEVPDIAEETPITAPQDVVQAPSAEVQTPEPIEPAKELTSPPPKEADIFSDAKSILATGDVGKAVELFSKLIKRGHMLDEIISELQESLYNYPVDFQLWQTLGDAYLRADRLQEALDTYTKAEELLR